MIANLTDEDLDDIDAALRIAAAAVEMTALHLVLGDWDPRDVKNVQADIRRQAGRYRKLANRLRKGSGEQS